MLSLGTFEGKTHREGSREQRERERERERDFQNSGSEQRLGSRLGSLFWKGKEQTVWRVGE
jgi:hypothetical protein